MQVIVSRQLIVHHDPGSHHLPLTIEDPVAQIQPFKGQMTELAASSGREDQACIDMILSTDQESEEA